MEPQQVIVPPNRIIAAPACRVCGQPFANPQDDSWAQTCACPPVQAGPILDIGGAEGWAAGAEYLDPALVGQELPWRCLQCDQPLPPGSQAVYGVFGPWAATGYAHPGCVAKDDAGRAGGSG